MFDLVFRNQTTRKTFGQAFFTLLLKAALGVLKPKGVVEVSVSLIGPARSRALNKKWRKKDAPTDVLSFPLGDTHIPQYNEGITGDIVLCLAVCRSKAREAGMSERAYVAWAFVHGVLHLAGYDHEKSPAAEKKMFAVEKKILKKLSL